MMVPVFGLMLVAGGALCVYVCCAECVVLLSFAVQNIKSATPQSAPPPPPPPHPPAWQKSDDEIHASNVSAVVGKSWGVVVGGCLFSVVRVFAFSSSFGGDSANAAASPPLRLARCLFNQSLSSVCLTRLLGSS
jgi:hypothetical protein